MNVLRLAWQNISGHTFRSLVVGICALLLAAFALFATVVLRGAETSLQLASDRLGADIVATRRNNSPGQVGQRTGLIGQCLAFPISVIVGGSICLVWSYDLKHQRPGQEIPGFQCISLQAEN